VFGNFFRLVHCAYKDTSWLSFSSPSLAALQCKPFSLSASSPLDIDRLEKNSYHSSSTEQNIKIEHRLQMQKKNNKNRTPILPTHYIFIHKF
jgi:hypothetical protein